MTTVKRHAGRFTSRKHAEGYARLLGIKSSADGGYLVEPVTCYDVVFVPAQTLEEQILECKVQVRYKKQEITALENRIKLLEQRQRERL
jgi:hypothetical protein